MNRKLSATKKKMEIMSSIPEPQQLIRKKKYVNHVLPILKERFSGKYIELDFMENLALCPKHEV